MENLSHERVYIAQETLGVGVKSASKVNDEFKAYLVTKRCLVLQRISDKFIQTFVEKLLFPQNMR